MIAYRVERRRTYRPLKAETDRIVLDQGDQFDLINRCLVINYNPVQKARSLRGSFVIVRGDLDGCTHIVDSVVLCLGDLKQLRAAENSVILATGRISIGNLDRCLVQANGDVTCDHSEKSTFVNLRKSPARESKDDRCVQMAIGPLDLFHAETPSAEKK